MPTILITGANRGIGLALARHYAADGWRVHATAREPGKADELNAMDGAEIHALDVTDHSAIAQLAEKIDEPLDVVVANAGVDCVIARTTIVKAIRGAAYRICAIGDQKIIIVRTDNGRHAAIVVKGDVKPGEAGIERPANVKSPFPTIDVVKSQAFARARGRSTACGRGVDNIDRGRNVEKTYEFFGVTIIDGDCITAQINDIAVKAIARKVSVTPRAADDRVGPFTAKEAVIARAAVQRVVACAPLQKVIARPTKDAVIARATDQRVAAASG